MTLEEVPAYWKDKVQAKLEAQNKQGVLNCTSFLWKGVSMPIEGNAEILERLTGRISNMQLDTTLTKQGMCAESKAVGDAIANLQAQIDELKNKQQGVQYESKGNETKGARVDRRIES